MRSGLVRFHQSLDGLMVDIDTLKPHPENANNGDVDAIIESITVNGFYPQPLVVDARTSEIVIGNHRYFALKELGSEVAPVLYADDDEQIAMLRIMLVDNRTNDLRRYDMGQLEKVLSVLETSNALRGSGFNQEYLHRLREGDRRAAQAVADANEKKDPVPLAGGIGVMFLEVTDEDKERFYRFTSGASDTERFRYLLDIAEEIA